MFVYSIYLYIFWWIWRTWHLLWRVLILVRRRFYLIVFAKSGPWEFLLAWGSPGPQQVRGGDRARSWRAVPALRRSALPGSVSGGRWRRRRPGGVVPHGPRCPRFHVNCRSALRPDGGEAPGPFVRPERACECRAVVGTGRVHTACEKGQWGLDISTPQKPSSFVMQPLSVRLSCKLPSLISRGWRGRKRAKPRAGPGALGGSTPLPEGAAGTRPPAPWPV